MVFSVKPNHNLDLTGQRKDQIPSKNEHFQRSRLHLGVKLILFN